MTLLNSANFTGAEPEVNFRLVFSSKVIVVANDGKSKLTFARSTTVISLDTNQICFL